MFLRRVMSQLNVDLDFELYLNLFKLKDYFSGKKLLFLFFFSKYFF